MNTGILTPATGWAMLGRPSRFDSMTELVSPMVSAATPIEIPPLDARDVGRLVRTALDAVRGGEAYGAKAVLEPIPEELTALLGEAARNVYVPGERANWKLSTLISVNATYGAVKIVGSHSYNRQQGLPRSCSTLLLYDKLTMRSVAIFDGTALSAQRTGAYASIVIDRLLRHHAKFSVYLFGAGRVAQSVVADLDAHHADRVEALYVNSRTHDSATTFVNWMGPRVRFPVIAPQDRRAHLPDCTLIVTASNADAPLFEAWEVGEETVVLHLGGDEIPRGLVEYVLEAGTVICDDVHTVAHRNSQSLPLYFARIGRSLQEVTGRYQILNLWQIDEHAGTRYRLPALVTCVGLPVLDLYLAQHVYETAREADARSAATPVPPS